MLFQNCTGFVFVFNPTARPLNLSLSRALSPESGCLAAQSPPLLLLKQVGTSGGTMA